MPHVTPAVRTDFAQILPLLREFPNQRLSSDDWHRLLFDPPWPVPEDRVGYVLRDGDEVVGFLGTILSTRTIRGRAERFCNLSSWIVRESHRSASLQLVFPVLSIRDHTIVNLTASPTAHEVFRSLGFSVLERALVLVPMFAGLGRLGRSAGVRLLADPARIAAALMGADRERAEHVARTHAAQVLLTRGPDSCHAVATASAWRGHWRLAHVQYASDWSRLWAWLPLVNRGFLASLSALGLRVDGRFAADLPASARRRELEFPTLYRPAHAGITPADVDGLYTELLLQPRP